MSSEPNLELIKTVHMIKRAIDNEISQCTKTSLTVPQAHVIAFLHDNTKKHDIFQKNIEDAFELHRSSVSLMLGNMEKNGLIVREAVEEDGRLRKIVLTEKAIGFHKDTMVTIKKVKAKIFKDISQDEQDKLLEILNKMQQNLK